MPRKHVALILVEGETEEVFYKRLSEEKLGGIPKQIRNMKGNFNINNKIVDKCKQYSDSHPNNSFDVYVCVDRERVGMPVYNKALVDEKINAIRGFGIKVDIIAELMIESLFFIDIHNIYAQLRTPKNQRYPKRYKNFRGLTHKDMSRLFEKNGKQYYKGIKCEFLVKNLDLDLIIGGASELGLLVGTVKARHNKFNMAK